MLQDPLSKPRPPDHTAAAGGGGGGGGGGATVQASDRKHINGSDGLARNSGRASAAGLQGAAGGGGGGGGGGIIIKCPRCDSMNTKFCYYNNYSLTQPRHFCKNCRRYWTQGGSLRNVPVGGGCRKNKRLSKPIISSSAAAAAMAPPQSSACNYSRIMALDPPGLLMDMNHLDMATNLNAHHRHRHRHPPPPHHHHHHHHQSGGNSSCSGHGHPYGAANLMMMMPGGGASSPFPMDAMIDPSLPDPQQLGHSLSMNHPPPVVAGDGSHLLSMAFSRLQESLRLNGGGEHMISSQEAEHKSNQCGQQLSLMTTMNPNPNFNPNPSPNPNFNPNPNPNPNLNLNPNPNPNPNLNPSPNINNACLNMIPTPPFEHDSRSPVNVFSHHHHHQNNAASMKSESAGNHSSVFTAASVNGSAAGRLGSMEDQLPASFSHGSHRSSADSNGPLSPAMNLPASNNAAHFDLEARLKLQQQRQLALHLGAGDAYHHHNHHHSHSHHHQSFNIMQDDHHINQSIDAANAINVITANNNHHNHNNSSSSNLSVFDDPSDRSETLNMLRRHIQHANNCSQDEGSNNVDSSNKLVLASHGDGDGYGGDHAHDAGMNSASANHELTTTNHHHYVGADHHQQQLISFWNHSNGGSINPTIWNK